MAGKRRKKKKTALTKTLKYEIYGIILITLSIIALSGEAAVGRSLSKMAALLLGKFYFVIPLVGIYVGLAVMIHRRWPNRWSSRKSGILLAVLSFALMSTISAMELKLVPISALTPNHIFNQIRLDLQHALSLPGYGGAVSIFNLDISGGYIGAAQFALLCMLFGLTGSKLILIVMFAISFMLITNLSFVELGRIVRTRIVNLGEQASRKWRMFRAVPAGQKSGKPKPVSADDDDEDDDDDFHNPDVSENKGPSSKAKTPVFFQLLGFKNKEKQLPEEDEEQPADDIIVAGSPVNWNEVSYTGTGQSDDAADRLDQPEDRRLIIRDFFDQIQTENRVPDEEPDDALEAADAAGPKDKPRELYKDSSENVSEHELGDHGSASGSNEDPSLAGSQHASSPDALGESLENIEAEPPKPQPKPYRLPSFRLLAKPNNGGKSGDQADYMSTARKLEATLESFGVRARVLEVVRGPAVTRYEIQPDIGVKVSRIVNLTDDIALALAAKDIRMEAPIPGKSAIGIEVPNNEVSVVTMREVMETPTFQEAESKLTIAFGRDISGQTIIGNLAKMPHLLVAGATGSGKSVCINGIITSILFKAKPDEVKFMMVDPKMVELNVYNGIPHLLTPVVTDPKRASLALKKIVVEMEKRYEKFSKSGTRNIEGYNKLMKENPEALLPYIVVIVDELADLMMVAAGDVEDAIARLAQMARAAGIHLIIATQRPSVDVITGVIKANIPSRIAFGVSSQVDSRTILDMAGAEKLLGRGDMLFMPMGASKPVRVQGAFMSDQEVETIVHYVSGQGQAEYDESLVPEVDESQQEHEEVLDELYDQAVQIILEAKQASVSLLQRRMRVGYTRAARLIDSMEARGVVGPYEGSKPREVLLSMEQYRQSRISS
ncbi:DNA translocase FtsK [Paenibacillus caui]|uniref:FtsK/SpoIIIE family DNA translocase n=1 Tax=Paenibacillus caui TaxID=2873927 RepID=UPI00307FEDE2